MKWVRLENNIVREIIPDMATRPSVAFWFGAAFAAECVQAPAEVEQHWSYDPETDTWSVPLKQASEYNETYES